MVLAFAIILFFGILFAYVFVHYPEAFQKDGLLFTATIMTAFFWVLIFGGAISLFFSKMEIDEEGLTVQTPWVRMLYHRGFPFYFRFDEITIKPLWNGRILLILRGEQLDWRKRIAWSTILLGGYWVMPFNWRKTMYVIEKLQGQKASLSE
jgi:hypothetical protein